MDEQINTHAHIQENKWTKKQEKNSSEKNQVKRWQRPMCYGGKKQKKTKSQ